MFAVFEGQSIDLCVSGGNGQIEDDLNVAVVEKLLDGADPRDRVFGGESLGSLTVEVSAGNDLDMMEFTAAFQVCRADFAAADEADGGSVAGMRYIQEWRAGVLEGWSGGEVKGESEQRMNEGQRMGSVQ